MAGEQEGIYTRIGLCCMGREHGMEAEDEYSSGKGSGGRQWKLRHARGRMKEKTFNDYSI